MKHGLGDSSVVFVVVALQKKCVILSTAKNLSCSSPETQYCTSSRLDRVSRNLNLSWGVLGMSLKPKHMCILHNTDQKKPPGNSAVGFIISG